jgi:hypothetical protein
MSKDLPVAPEVRAHATTTTTDDWRLDQLISRLPGRVRSAIRFVRHPSRRWLRIPVGILLTFGGVLGFLPIMGFWMIPVGLALLADDVPLLRSYRSRILDWVARRHAHWFVAEPDR